MNKITYLFGAGASKHALPLVNEISKNIERLIGFLKQDALTLDDKSTFEDLFLQSPKTKREYQLEMIDALQWMMKESKNHASIDTFAKKLFIKQKHWELKKLKIAMSIFFIFEQAINKPDFRYDSFFASIFDSLSKFPDHIRILSWNYDYQFELSFSEYSDNHEIITNQNWLNVKAKYTNHRNDKGFGIYKLNGTTGLNSNRYLQQFLYAPNLNVPVDLDFVSLLTRNFAAATYVRDIYPSLSFAWEKENDENSIVKKAMEDTIDSISLVVIGYSFPFFNRDIDRKIIGNMKNIKRVYFQAPDADILKERFQAIRDDLLGIDLVTKFDVGQFLLPNEL